MTVRIPEELRYFSTEGEAELPESVCVYPYFKYELGGEKPWESEKSGLPLLESAWAKMEQALDEKQRIRSKDVKEEVDALLAMFFMALFWVNGQPAAPVLWKEKQANFAVKPINFLERFTYIDNRPYTYMAYRQLIELMTELKKAAAVYAIKNPR
ncbi:hypothetical protein RRU94_15285 [Domibacillus sp. DTU_2020_1001157_1_SI_ALB_TIR_016]|uniref:YpoC family protein n=1 Tax=Domibacillus sp. DTU_2020_1001157_1_SI_ALB_TIR_016 TaxID=3077789 RepID=UPI0028E24497|nr:hypothetical protein [Domibacillus sp. DTU_2020_1001157_1_SI_ALB_TIR_016]WNS82116.1 hypothetical protein RRU94_15285 [Domibacillus sp. DTU_2020_1001157_1_SI_ALB_TIR_016]